MPDIIAHAFKDALYFANIAAVLLTAHKRNPEQPGSSQPIKHCRRYQAGFNRASSARLCATTEDHTNDLKWTRPFQVQRVSPSISTMV